MQNHTEANIANAFFNVAFFKGKTSIKMHLRSSLGLILIHLHVYVPRYEKVEVCARENCGFQCGWGSSGRVPRGYAFPCVSSQHSLNESVEMIAASCVDCSS